MSTMETEVWVTTSVAEAATTTASVTWSVAGGEDSSTVSVDGGGVSIVVRTTVTVVSDSVPKPELEPELEPELSEPLPPLIGTMEYVGVGARSVPRGSCSAAKGTDAESSHREESAKIRDGGR